MRLSEAGSVGVGFWCWQGWQKNRGEMAGGGFGGGIGWHETDRLILVTSGGYFETLGAFYETNSGCGETLKCGFQKPRQAHFRLKKSWRRSV